ncbi:MAG: EamA family transporter RarD [Deltaproteobacteria bacterium]|nr:EamA family transporter RarD [Deltaproteobacteria bacterium]
MHLWKHRAQPGQDGKGIPLEDRTKGALYGILAYGLWGVFPLYFKVVAEVPALEILAHRILWSFLVLLVLVAATRRGDAIRAIFRDRRTSLLLCGSTVLIATNWLIFVIAVATNRVLESSLGYFMNPLVNILLGRLFLSERLRGMQRVSLLLAVAGVALLVALHGTVPWISLALAVTFAFYALLRKLAPVESLAGLTYETGLLVPAAFLYIAWGTVSGNGAFLTGSNRFDHLLPLAGVITAFPLLAFGAAARRVRLSTLGFLQYISPTGHFLLAVFAFGEPFGSGELAAFLLIWAGLAVYSVDALRLYTVTKPGIHPATTRKRRGV